MSQDGSEPHQVETRTKTRERIRASLLNARVFGLSFPRVRQMSPAELEQLERALKAERWWEGA